VTSEQSKFEVKQEGGHGRESYTRELKFKSIEVEVESNPSPTRNTEDIKSPMFNTKSLNNKLNSYNNGTTQSEQVEFMISADEAPQFNYPSNMSKEFQDSSVIPEETSSRLMT